MQQVRSFEQALEYAKAALEKMQAHGVPANPQNFAVWFTYAAGSNQALSQGLDVLISNKIDFTYDRNLEIYEKYLGAESSQEEIGETAERIQSVADQVVRLLGEAQGGTSSYGDKLSDYSSQLASGQNIEGIVQSLLAETQKIVSQSKALEQSLSESSSEVADLRHHLEEVRQEALTDALTAIANRKFFDVQLREEAKNHTESGEALCLVLIDIDHFKRFNDNFGHRVGDEVLKLMGRVLKNGVKGRDTPARYGGEEFAVILPKTELNAAAVVAEQLRSSLATKELTNKKSGENYGKITISAGVAQYRFGEALGELVERADEALYRAKASGRNKVIKESELISLAAS